MSGHDPGAVAPPPFAGVDYENCIDLQLAEEITKLQRKRIKWNKDRVFLDPMVMELQKMGIHPQLGNYSMMFVNVSGDQKTLTRVVRAFRLANYQLSDTDNRPKPGSNTWNAVFIRLEAQFNIYLQFTSTVCKHVKTGTKLVEQDVYEIQCSNPSDVLTLDETPKELPDVQPPNRLPA